MPRVFLSYRRDDTGGLAARLAQRLKHDLGVDGAFLDAQDLEAGVVWRDRLDEQIRASAAVVALIGDRWGGGADGRRILEHDDVVRWELQTALMFERPLVPTMVGGARLPELLPPELTPLRAMHWLDLGSQESLPGYQVLLGDLLWKVFRDKGETVVLTHGTNEAVVYVRRLAALMKGGEDAESAHDLVRSVARGMAIIPMDAASEQWPDVIVLRRPGRNDADLEARLRGIRRNTAKVAAVAATTGAIAGFTARAAVASEQPVTDGPIEPTNPILVEQPAPTLDPGPDVPPPPPPPPADTRPPAPVPQEPPLDAGTGSSSYPSQPAEQAASRHGLRAASDRWRDLSIATKVVAIATVAAATLGVGLSLVTNFPFVDSHLPDATEGAPGRTQGAEERGRGDIDPLGGVRDRQPTVGSGGDGGGDGPLIPDGRTIPARQFWPDEPISVVYEYARGAKVSDRVVVAWDDDRLSVTFLDAEFYRQGEPRGAFRYIVGRENEPRGFGCYLAATTCNDRSFFGPGTDASAFFPGPGGTIPRFGGTLPSIEVDATETRGGVEVACGNAVDELWGDLRLCVHEPTGAVLYAHTITQCTAEDRRGCVELGAVEVGDPIPADFDLPGQ